MDDNNQQNNNDQTSSTQVEEQKEQAENAENAQVAQEAEEATETPAETITGDEPESPSEPSEADQSAQPAADQPSSEPVAEAEDKEKSQEEPSAATEGEPSEENTATKDVEALTDSNDDPNAKWYVVHTYSGHENKVATALKQRVESEHLENKILDVLVPTQDKIEIRSGKKNTVKEKIFPGYILVKMILDDNSWLAVRTTQGVTGFVGIGNKPTPIPTQEVRTIVKFMTQGAAPTFKDVFMVDDTVKIIDGPFSEFIGKVDSVDKEHGKVRVLVSIFGRETPVELDFLQVQKL